MYSLMQPATPAAKRQRSAATPLRYAVKARDALNSGVSGEGAQDITDHYPTPKGAKR